jgi:hypothetical protein
VVLLMGRVRIVFSHWVNGCSLRREQIDQE